MVNKVVLDYLRKYHGEYRIEDLKRKIVSSGYSEEEVEEALESLNLKASEEDSEEVETSSAKISFKKFIPEKTCSASCSKWLKVAGISGLFFLVLIILSITISLLTEVKFLSPLYHISFLLNSALFILFLFGFIVLGNKHSKKLIRFASWLFIILIALFIFSQILTIIFPEELGGIFLKIFAGKTSFRTLELKAVYNNLITLPTNLLLALTSILLVFIILNILFGIGLFSLREQVEKAKITGILHVVGAFLFFILPIAFIFEVVLLFKESRRY